jgi:Zn-dependent protease
VLKSFHLGRIFGFPLKVNLSFLFLLGVVLVATGEISVVPLVLMAFGFVVLHELGHALMARHLGVRIKEIELQFFGGAAKMLDMPRSPGDEIAIAAAGPAVSFLFAGLGHGLAAVTDVGLFATVGWINLGIGLFNLIPALPMDGGRILRALLVKRMGFVRATEASVKVARGFAVLLAVVGVVNGPLTLVLLAGMLWLMGSVERRMARVRGYGPGGFGDEAPVVAAEYLPPPRPAPAGGRGTFRVFITRF